MKLIDQPIRRRLALQSMWYGVGIGDWGAIVLFLAIVGGAVAWLLPNYTRLTGGAPPFSSPWNSELLAFGFFTFLACVIAYMILRAIGLVGEWEVLDFRGDEGLLYARKRGSVPYWGTVWEVPIQRVETLGMMARPGMNNLLKIELKVEFSDPATPPAEITFQVAGIDRRDEAIDLLLRFGRAAGCGWYFAGADVRNLAAQVHRSPSDKLPLQPIPQVTGEADYHADRTASGVEAPAIDVAPFCQTKFGQGFSWWQLRTWSPGEKVDLVRPRPHWALHVGAATLGIVIGGVVGAALFAPLLQQFLEVPVILSVVGSALAGGIIATLLAMYSMAHREVIIDWPQRIATLVYGSKTTVVPFSDIQKFVLQGLVHKTQEGSKNNRRTKITYACELSLLTIQGRQHHLLQNEKWRDGPDAPVDELAPLAADLSRSLGVEWEWREYRRV
jgi:hypothetical protein